MKNKYLNKFLKQGEEDEQVIYNSLLMKVDFKTKLEIQKANNRKRKKDADASLVNNEGNIIDIIGLNKYYISGGNSTQVLRNLSLSIKRGEFVVLFGKSGSGKTTLLNLMSGLDRPTTGSLIVCNKNLPYLSNTQLTTFRRENLSFIFQSYNLLTNLSGYDNVETGSYLQKDKSKKPDIENMFKEFDLEDVINKYPSQMSGGQQQRISILRALAKNSEIIFADEPTGALDKKTSKIVMELLQKINQELGKTIIMVSHDPGVVKYATRVIHLSKSKIISDEQVERGVEDPEQTLIQDEETIELIETIENESAKHHETTEVNFNNEEIEEIAEIEDEIIDAIEEQETIENKSDEETETTETENNTKEK